MTTNYDYTYDSEHYHTSPSASNQTTHAQHDTENTPPRGKRWLNILIWIGLMLICTIPTGLASLIIGVVVQSKKLNPFIFSVLLLLYLVITGLMIWLLTWYYHKKSYEVMRSVKLLDFGIDVLYFIGIRIWTALCMLLMFFIFKEQGSANDEMLTKQLKHLQDFHNPYVIIALIVFILHITFIGPFIEELTFRGIFKETIFSKFSFWWPMLISSAIFSVNHLSTNIIGFLMYMGMGAGFYLAYKRKGNIWDSYIVHVLNNASASIAIIIGLITM